MAGAFSGHLLNAFNSAPAQSSMPTIVTSGTMSFDARAHGNPGPSLPPFSPSALFGFTPLPEDSTTAKHIATLQAKLNKKLGPEYISQRPGPGGGPKLTYAEGWKIINLANEVFGFNGWSSSVVSITTDFVDHIEESRRFNVGVTAIVRVTLRDGVSHEDVGYGLLENAKSKGGALDKCKKEAITDALKRTLRNFGNLLGNCLYDKSYAQEVVKIKVPSAKFDKNELYRRPEFEERIPDTPATHGQAAVPESSSKRGESHIKVEHEDDRSATPISCVPRHLRQEMAAAAQPARVRTPTRALAMPPQRTEMHSHAHPSTRRSGSGTTDALADRGPPSADPPKHDGLVMPIRTSAQPPCLPPPRAPPPQTTATSPLARMGTTPQRSVSFTEPMPVHASSADSSGQDIGNTIQGNGNGGNRRNDEDEDEDAFPLSTQDDAFLATVDLGDGDLGRPIDFDEGVCDVSMIMDASVFEPGLDGVGRSPAALPEPQVRDGAGSGTSAGLLSGGTPKTNMRNEAQAHFVMVPPLLASGKGNADPNASASVVQPRPQPRSGAPDTVSVPVSSTSSVHAGPPIENVQRHRPAMTSMGGSPPSAQEPQQHTPKPVLPPCVRTTSNTPQTGPIGSTMNALKRNVDMMQAGSGSSTRPPIQGTGLAQRQRQQLQQQQQSTAPRHPSNNNEGNDLKRLKH